MKDQKLTKADLAQFTGTEVWYSHALKRNILYTEGMQYVAEKAGAYWLLDEIVFNQIQPLVASENFQVWILRVDLEKSNAVLTCDDGNGKIVYKKVISYTDFPLDEIKIYFIDNVVLLTSEY